MKIRLLFYVINYLDYKVSEAWLYPNTLLFKCRFFQKGNIFIEILEKFMLFSFPFQTLSYSFELKGAGIEIWIDITNILEFGDKVANIEDIKAKLNYSQQSTNLPLALELLVWENGEFVSDEILKKRVDYFKSLYPVNRKVS